MVTRAAVSAGDRAAMARVGVLASEAETDEAPTDDVRLDHVASANAWRLAHGIEPLTDESAIEPPELGFSRRARSLGLSDRGR